MIPYYPKAFRYHKISETQGSPYEIFRYCDTKRVDRIVIPILSKKFGNQNSSEKQTCSPTVIFGDVRQNKSTKLWYSYYLKSFDNRTFLKHKKVRRRCFSANWYKKTSTEKCDTPFLPINFFSTRTFLKDKSVPSRNFSVLWDKEDQQNRDTPIIKTFRYQNISETKAGSPTVIFGDVRQKNSTKLWHPFYLKSPDTRTFLKHRRVRRRCFSAIRYKKTSTEKIDTPFLPINFFSTRTFLKDKSVPSRSFSVLWD